MRRIILAAALLLAATPAHAQDSQDPSGPRRKISLPSIGSAAQSALAKPFQDLANMVGDDIDAAIALSTAIPGLQDGHGQQCFMALKSFGDVVKAHPVPLTLKAATDLEALRLLAMAANKVCADPHCTQVFADLANGIQVAAPVNVSIPIPSLHDACVKVPQIAVAAPVAAAPDVPAPTPPAKP